MSWSWRDLSGHGARGHVVDCHDYIDTAWTQTDSCPQATLYFCLAKQQTRFKPTVQAYGLQTTLYGFHGEGLIVSNRWLDRFPTIILENIISWSWQSSWIGGSHRGFARAHAYCNSRSQRITTIRDDRWSTEAHDVHDDTVVREYQWSYYAGSDPNAPEYTEGTVLPSQRFSVHSRLAAGINSMQACPALHRFCTESVTNVTCHTLQQVETVCIAPEDSRHPTYWGRSGPYAHLQRLIGALRIRISGPLDLELPRTQVPDLRHQEKLHSHIRTRFVMIGDEGQQIHQIHLIADKWNPKLDLEKLPHRLVTDLWQIKS